MATDYKIYGEIYILAIILYPLKKLYYFALIDWQGNIDYMACHHDILEQEFC
jgi:hypothetical protein